MGELCEVQLNGAFLSLWFRIELRNRFLVGIPPHEAIQSKKYLVHLWFLIKAGYYSTAGLAHTTLIRFEGADHAFKKGKENLLPLLAEETAKWIASTK
jgi:hypothetical protein